MYKRLKGKDLREIISVDEKGNRMEPRIVIGNVKIICKGCGVEFVAGNAENRKFHNMPCWRNFNKNKKDI